MRGLVTAITPAVLIKSFSGGTAETPRPVAEKPSGMTFAINDVVWYEMDVRRKVIVIAKLVAA